MLFLILTSAQTARPRSFIREGIVSSDFSSSSALHQSYFSAVSGRSTSPPTTLSSSHFAIPAWQGVRLARKRVRPGARTPSAGQKAALMASDSIPVGVRPHTRRPASCNRTRATCQLDNSLRSTQVQQAANNLGIPNLRTRPGMLTTLSVRVVRSWVSRFCVKQKP